MGFEGGGRTQDKCGRQTSVEKQLKTMLKEIPEVTRERRRQEFSRHGEVEGGS